MRNPMFAYFDYMHSKGWLSTDGTPKDFVVAVVLPAVAITAIMMSIFSVLARVVP